MSSDYTPGSLQQTIFGSKSSEINNDLDALFRNSAGPIQVPAIISKESPIKCVEKTKNLNVDDNESVLCKKKYSWEDGHHSENDYKKASHNKKLEKSIEKNYEIKVMKKEMKPSYKKVSSETNEEIDLNFENQLKRKLSVKDSISQKKTKFVEDIVSDESKAGNKSRKNIELDEETNIQVKPKKGSTDPKTATVDDNQQSIKRDDPERLQRTIFVGNLSVSVIQKANHKKLKSFFSQFGKIESIRFRSIAFSELLPRRLAFITGKLHPERDVLNAYIVYKDVTSAQQAITMNAQVFLGKHLRVDSVANPQNHDRRRTVFIGSLSFDAQEEELWLHFESCGEIENVRIVRDSRTNVGKGFAYVRFKERASIELALKLNDTKLGTRRIRVTRCAKGNHISKPALNKPAIDKPKIGKVKFGKKLIEDNKISSRKLEKGKLIQKHDKLSKQTFEGTRTIKGKSSIQDHRIRKKGSKKKHKKG